MSEPNLRPPLAPEADAVPEDEQAELGPEPHTALHYHFGMLLGVGDLQTEQAYHRGKLRLHQAWLHRAGVLWGFQARIEGGELLVSAGLGLDAVGRELYLDRPMSLDVGAWFDEQKAAAERGRGDAEYLKAAEAGQPIDAYVVARYHAGLTREVPSLGGEGDERGGTSASRVRDDVTLHLLPGSPPAPTPLPSAYWRVRLLLGLDATLVADNAPPNLPDRTAELNELVKVRATLAVLTAAERAQRLQEAAARDVAELQPRRNTFGDRGHFPEASSGGAGDGLVLAAVRGIRITRPDGTRARLQGDAAVDYAQRPVHLPATVWSLLAGGGSPPAAAPTAPLVGPQVVRDSVRLVKEHLRIRTTRPLLLSSLDAETLVVRSIPSSGDKRVWRTHSIVEVSRVRGTTNELSVQLADWPGGEIVRVLLRGRGAAVVLGEDGTPLTGAG